MAKPAERKSSPAPRRREFVDEDGTVDADAFAQARLNWLTALQDRAARDRRQRCGIGARLPELPGPTEETRARLKPDQLLRLIRSGKLESVHLAAADEIRAIF